MVLNEESGVDGEYLAIGVKRYPVAGFRVTFTIQIGYKLILEPANGNEGCRVVGDQVLGVDGALKDAAIISDIILGVGNHRDPLRSIKIGVVNVEITVITVVPQRPLNRVGRRRY
jgi:hypothetical protein